MSDETDIALSRESVQKLKSLRPLVYFCRDPIPRESQLCECAPIVDGVGGAQFTSHSDGSLRPFCGEAISFDRGITATNRVWNRSSKTGELQC